MKKRPLLIVSIIAAALLIAAVIGVYFIRESRKSENSDGTETAEAGETEGEINEQVYYDAVKKVTSVGFQQYTVKTSNLVSFMDRQDVYENSGEVRIINKKAADPRYHASFKSGDEVEDYYYSGGYAYSSVGEAKLRSQMTEDEFIEFIEGRSFTALGEDFYKLELTSKADGSYKANFDGLVILPEKVRQLYYDLGMTDIKVRGFSGEAEIDPKGRLIAQSSVLKLTMKRAGEDVAAEYSCDVKYSNPGQKFTLIMPDTGAYEETGSIVAANLIDRAYENFLYHSYDGSYDTHYGYTEPEGGARYSMELKYSAKVDQERDLKASDTTEIVYNLKKNNSTVTRTTAYSDGVLVSDSNGSSSEREMDVDSARSAYYHNLLDNRPSLEDMKSLTLVDKGDHWEATFDYDDSKVKALCQTVLISVIGDKDGIAVNSENYTVNGAKGKIKIDKKTNALISHEIGINVLFKEEKSEFTVEYRHLLNMKVR